MTNVVSPGYFNALRIDFLDGRNFDERDKMSAQKVVVINQYMAEQLWRNESAIGKRIFIGTDDHSGVEVIGVVKTGRYRNLAEDPRSFMYFPVTQRRPGIMTLVARTNGDPRNFVGAIRHELQLLDRTVPVSSVKTMPEHMTWPLWAPNMASTLSLAFGIIALMLSSVGLYSVMAYVVSQRTKEVGIRMALGASRKDVLQMITSQGMRLALIGGAIGLALSLALAKVVSSLLIGISGYDLTTFVVVSALLAAVAFIASLLPARRATKVDPLVALRYE
jgi:putative ABC transport system permease protein